MGVTLGSVPISNAKSARKEIVWFAGRKPLFTARACCSGRQEIVSQSWRRLVLLLGDPVGVQNAIRMLRPERAMCGNNQQTNGNSSNFRYLAFVSFTPLPLVLTTCKYDGPRSAMSASKTLLCFFRIYDGALFLLHAWR